MRISVFSPRRVVAAVLSPAALSTALSAALSVSLAFPLATVPLAARADDAPAAAPKDTVRAEVGKPLQEAQALMVAKKYKDALAKIKEAEAIANRTPYENFVIDRLRGSAAANDGQDELALSSFESVVSSGRMPPADQLKLVQAIAVTYYSKLKNYPKAVSWATRYIKDGGTDPTAQDLLINSHYLGGEYAEASVALKKLIDADDAAGRTTTEQHILLLLTCYQKQKDGNGASAMLEKLLISYPKKEYWEQAISHLVHKAGFAERLDLDLLRLRMALGDLKRDADYMDMGQLSLEAGYPIEAKKAIDQGFSSGVLGKGAEADRQKRLQSLINKEAASDLKSIDSGDVDAEKSKTGDGLVNAGFNYVLNGKFVKGLALMEQGIKKGGLRHAEDSKLHLGIALFLAGDKAKAVQVLRSVQGNDGVADIAHLWAVHVGKA
jgi:tetratricopeptide (TPR) repeat protein